MGDPVTPRPFDPALRLLSRRLRWRWALQSAGVGLAIGLGLGTLVESVRVLGWGTERVSWLFPVLAAGIGAAYGASRRPLSDSVLALLLDRLLGTHEVLTTAVLASSGAGDERFRPTIDEAAEKAAARVPGALPKALPLVEGRRLLPLLLVGYVVLVLSPATRTPAATLARAGDPAAEALVLDARRREIAELSSLPAGLDAELKQLTQAMRADGASAALAAAQAHELARKIDELAASGAGANPVATAARDAAAALDPRAGQELGEALAKGDLVAAAEAVRAMRDRSAGATTEERTRSAEALRSAARAAEGAGQKNLAEALSHEAGRMDGSEEPGRAASSGGSGTAGNPGGRPPGAGATQGGQKGTPTGDSGQGLAEYFHDLEQAGVGMELRKDAERQKAARQLSGALEGAAGRMEEGKGGGADGPRDGEGRNSTAADGRGEQDWGAGSKHSDLDEGTHGNSGRGFQDRDRQVDGRTQRWTVSASPVAHDRNRLQGVRAEASSVHVPVEDPTQVEQLPFRRGGSDEVSVLPRFGDPAVWEQASREAVEKERVPAPYREQVRRYFDGGAPAAPVPAPK